MSEAPLGRSEITSNIAGVAQAGQSVETYAELRRLVDQFKVTSNGVGQPQGKSMSASAGM